MLEKKFGTQVDDPSIYEEFTKRKRGRKRKYRKWTKDPNSPKKALTPYILYGKSVRAQIMEELQAKDPSKKPTDVMREISTRWHKLTPEERLPYIEQGLKEKERYQIEYSAWLETQKDEESLEKGDYQSEYKAWLQQKSYEDQNNNPNYNNEEGEQYYNEQNNFQHYYKKTFKVRADDEVNFDHISISYPSLENLVESIQQKRNRKFIINSLVCLPNLQITCDEDVRNLPDNSEIIISLMSSLAFQK